MTKAFSDFMDSWPTLKDSCGTTEGRSASSEVAASSSRLAGETARTCLTSRQVGYQAPPAGMLVEPLDATVERVLAVNRVIANQEARRKEAEREVQEAIDRETMRKDFDWWIYRQCDQEDAAEFAYLLKHEGDPNHIPHDCLEELIGYVCGICGAYYEPMEIRLREGWEAER